MRALPFAAIALAACGGAHSGTSAAPVASNQAKPPTCLDAARVLRQKAPDLKADETELGNVLQEAIRVACDHDVWSADAISCITSGDTPFECLEPKLTADQQKGYQDRLETALDDFMATHMHTDVVLCEDAIGDASQYGPALDLDGEALTWAVKLRRIGLIDICNRARWDNDIVACLAKATGRPSHAACLDKLEDAEDRADVVTRLASIDKVAHAMALARKSPANLTCDAVATTYYSAARWEDHIDGYEDAQRERYNQDSRAKMIAACKREKWGDALRACLVAGGNEACLTVDDRMQIWTFPARGLDPAADKEHERR